MCCPLKQSGNEKTKHFFLCYCIHIPLFCCDKVYLHTVLQTLAVMPYALCHTQIIHYGEIAELTFFKKKHTSNL